VTDVAFDAEAFKASARKGWSLVADGWQRWWRTFEQAAQPLNERLVELARIEPGARVLDVATGIGEPALTAALRVGPEGSVLATDLSPRMIELARARARERGAEHMTVREADAERLELEPASFDAALSRWGLMLFPHPEAALERIHGALRPGGRLACAVWSTPDRVPFLTLGREAAARELGLPPPHADAPGPFRLAEPGRLAQLLERADLAVELVEAHPVRFAFASAEQYADFVFELSGHLAHGLAEASEAARRRAREALLDEARSEAGPDGALVLENEALCAVGRR